MAEIQPFRAYRYDTNRVALKTCSHSPTTKSRPRCRSLLRRKPLQPDRHRKGPHLPDDTPANNVYTRAAAKVDEWIAEKILEQDAAPAIYIYSQEFLVPGTSTRRTRIGFIALGRVEDYDAKVVFRHEHTLSGPKADRIELLRHTHAANRPAFFSV